METIINKGRSGATNFIHGITRMFILLSFVLTGILGDSHLCNYTTVLEWKSLNYHTPEHFNVSMYVPENNIIGISRYYRGRLFITVPRYRSGVLSSLNTVSMPSKDKSPKLRPFPSWELNQVNDCNNYQNVVAIEIDPLGRLWIADNGIIDMYTKPIRKCQPKLVIYDLIGNKELQRHQFASSKPNVDRIFKQVVVDLSAYKATGESIAYISDGGAQQILVYSFKKNVSWSVASDEMSTRQNPTGLTSAGNPYYLRLGVSGLALLHAQKESDEKLLFSRIAPDLFGLDKGQLESKDDSETSAGEVSAGEVSVKGGGVGESSESMTSDIDGVVYLATLATSTLYSFNQNKPKDSQWKEECRLPNETFPWLDSPNFDEHGDLWIVSNRYHEFAYQYLEVGKKNVFSVIKIPLHRYNYMKRYVDYASKANLRGSDYLLVLLSAIATISSGFHM